MNNNIQISAVCPRVCLANTDVNAKNIIKFIRWFGTNSFYAMAIHLPLKAALLAIPAYILHTNTGKGICSNIWYSFAAFVSTTVATSFVIFLINKLKFKYPRIGNYI